MRKLSSIATLSLLATLAAAQVPDVRVSADLGLYITAAPGGLPRIRTYSPLGKYSLFSAKILLEPGITLRVVQRVQPIENDVDNEFFDEYVVEDPGNFRIGKQYLPFGSGAGFMHESTMAIRADTNVVLEALPITLAYCDGGKDRQQGIVGRIGPRSLGFSFAVGRHFGISSLAFIPIRRLDEGLGRASGYRTVLGVDASRRLGPITLAAEAVAFSRPELSAVREVRVYDLRATLDLKSRRTLLLGYARDLNEDGGVLRLVGTYAPASGLGLDAVARTRDGRFFEFGLGARFRF